jgi:hypothetical protein
MPGCGEMITAWEFAAKVCNEAVGVSNPKMNWTGRHQILGHLGIRFSDSGPGETGSDVSP